MLFFTLGFFVGREFYDIDFIDATTGAIDYVIYTIKGIGGVTAVVALVNLIFAIKQRRKR